MMAEKHFHSIDFPDNLIFVFFHFRELSDEIKIEKFIIEKLTHFESHVSVTPQFKNFSRFSLKT